MRIGGILELSLTETWSWLGGSQLRCGFWYAHVELRLWLSFSPSTLISCLWRRHLYSSFQLMAVGEISGQNSESERGERAGKTHSQYIRYKSCQVVAAHFLVVQEEVKSFTTLEISGVYSWKWTCSPSTCGVSRRLNLETSPIAFFLATSHHFVNEMLLRNRFFKTTIDLWNRISNVPSGVVGLKRLHAQFFCSSCSHAHQWLVLTQKVKPGPCEEDLRLRTWRTLQLASA